MTTEQRPLKELIILGKGPSRVECLYDHETWCCNDSYDFAKRIDKLFVTDGWNLLSIPDMKRFQPKYNYEIISSAPCPDSTLKVTLFPIEEVITKFKTSYFSNTIVYMIAYALLFGYERLWFYGIDMSSYSCYLTERGCVEYWMGICKGMGVEIVNTKNSSTGKTVDGRIYGDWGDKEPAIAALIKANLKNHGYGKNHPPWVDSWRREVGKNDDIVWSSGPLNSNERVMRV